MKISYNSPLILNFSIVCLIIFGIAHMIPGIMENLFVNLGVFDYSHPLDYWRLFSHVLGHASAEHLFGNLMLILLIGPLLEEKYGAQDLGLIMILTALAAGVANVFFTNTGLLGASSIAFAFVILGSVGKGKSGVIPLTLIITSVLYLGKEFLSLHSSDQISHLAHIVGGLCGAAFGIWKNWSK